MRKLLLIFLFCATGLAFGNNLNTYNLPELRKKYLAASQDSEEGKSFYALMSSYKEKEPVVMAYKAVSEATMAKYVWNPYQKLKHLKQSAAIFDEAVQLDNQNPEIHFLRFTVEHYVPRYLNLSNHVAEDKKIIMQSLKAHPNSGISPEWARTMRDFMLTKDHCTEEEKKVLRNVNI
ncbi:hypothetical protein FVR03_13640 [Pontibacter qinzhouensis]|uniref:Uncharacterized protein n=1 Tax=Pontibacter qinzhouensis TaxID=2603253 RepID=A0A5C8K1C2_9BACT|nr:hypothetical protein [Pontibacter qinzhouensis]TXK44460.1 hypothetical protein FVR03_13640 [Pontibacter qinzhouensis]